jgi:hypothetical protein
MRIGTLEIEDDTVTDLYDARRDTDIAIAPKVFARLEQWARTR